MQRPHTDIPRHSHRFSLYFFLAAGVLLGAIGFRHRGPTVALKPAASRKAMTLKPLPRVDGPGGWDLADHLGQVVLINYWATWCGPCQEELPTLLQISREYTPKGLAIIGISLDSGADAPTKVRQFAARFRIPYPLALPAPDTINTTVFALPTTLLIDRHGRTARTYQGPVSRENLTNDIAALLAEN